MQHPEPAEPKGIWRSWAKAKRENLAENTAESIILHLVASSLYQEAEHILTYLAFGSEISLAALHLDSKKTFYTTRTHFKPEPHLTIHKLDSDLEQHKYGYWQPVANSPVEDAHSIDLVLVPGLAFDRSGGRLGYGMGFYDRLLEQTHSNCLFAAITSDSLVVQQLPQEPWDKKMTHIVTESTVYTV